MPKATKNGGASKRKKAPRRSDWEANQAAIEVAYMELWEELKRRPTCRQVADRVGLHYTRVAEHIRGFNWKEYRRGTSLRVVVPKVIERLAEKILLGDYEDIRAQEVRLLLEVLVGHRRLSPDAQPTDVDAPKVVVTLPDNGRPSQALPDVDDDEEGED